MAGVLESVDQRTKMVGQNRLELLLFKLNGEQVYGINVFKVKEVLQCPKLTVMPKLNPVVRGVAHIRGGTISIMDLSQATGQGLLDDADNCFVIISEYNMQTQGFLVRSVERIVNMNWEDIHPPPKGSGSESYLTAVTEIENRLVEIIDVEKVLAEVSPMSAEVSEGIVDETLATQAIDKHILIVDDSAIARKQIRRCVESCGVTTTMLNDGRQALSYLQEIADRGEKVTDKLLMMISDIEMPEMDGYTLTSEVRADSRMCDLHILLHTSLSGIFNETMVQQVGANDFLAKFNPDGLALLVAERIKETTPGSEH